MKPLLVLAVTLLGFVSCKKANPINEIPEPEFHWMAIISPSPYSSINSIFKASETELKEAIIVNDTIKQKRLTIKLANNIVSYIYKTQQVDIRKEFIDDPNGVVSLGLLLERKEYYTPLSSKPTNSEKLLPSPEMDCLFAALGGLVGINEARTMWATLMGEGVILDSAIAAARFIGKKVGVALSVTLLLRDVGDCFGWWHF